MMNRLTAALAYLLLALPLLAHAAPEDELLAPDQAFALTTRVLDARTIEASWKIAPDYYLYRDKIKFESLDPSVTLRPAIFPTGKKKNDPFFGVSEIYYRAVAARVPFERANAGMRALRLRITAQGCNEPVGVCYTPIVKEISLALPTAGATEPPSGAKQIGSLKELAGSSDPLRGDGEIADPEKAFRVSVTPEGAAALRVRFDIDECCYLYRNKTDFALARADGTVPDLRLGGYTLPKGKPKTDEFLGKTEVYYRGFEVRLPVASLGRAAGDYRLEVGYQGCSEKGVALCYPPAKKFFAVSAAGGVVRIAALDAAGGGPFADASGTQAEAPARNGGKFLLAMAAGFGVGLLLTFTPCVLPMIPILSSVIVGSSDRRLTKFEGGLLSLAYVLGTAVTYTAAGAVAGATGEQLQAYFQNAWMLGIFAALFAALALSMFGLYELQIPAFLQSHLHRHSHEVHSRTRHIKGGAFLGVFAMGLISALIIGACVSPLFLSALGIAIANRDPVLGGAIMFSMALGMGVILVAIGVGAGFLLPKAGLWMGRVKHVFGVLLLGVSIYLLGFIPEVPVLLLWAALFIVAGVYLGATQSLPAGAGGWKYLWKGVGTALLIWGAAALLGGLAGRRDILAPLPIALNGAGVTIGAAPAPAEAEPLFARVTSLRALETRLAEARRAGRPALLDYYADWCTDCLRMEKATFADPKVRAELKDRRYLLLQADVTDPTRPETRAIKGRFGVYGPPAMLFFDTGGVERRDLRAYGFRTTEQFLDILRQVK